jgi:deoxyribose-phosphate aldolase
MNPVKDWKSIIEYTNLKSPSSKEIRTFVETANKEKYYGVCMQYGDLGVAAKYRSPDLKLITVAGFPPFAAWPHFKNERRDPRMSLYLGLYGSREIDSVKGMIDDPHVDELDLVFPMLWYARGELGRIYKFFKGVKQRFKKPVKVITELGTIFRNRINLFEIADLIEQSGVDFFKTNTGLIPGNFNLMAAGIQEVRDLKPNMRFKASGGIRTLSQVRFLMSLGVERIGTSNITDDTVQLKAQDDKLILGKEGVNKDESPSY